MTFRSVLQLVLRKSVKSLQLVLNEWAEHFEEGISASAFSQARHKFRHTAFIELLEKGVIEVMYQDDDFAKFKGHRLLAVDGTSLRLPNTPETRETFGLIEHLNGNKTPHGNQVEAKMTVLYDVLNRIPLSAYLHEGRVNDLKASKNHLCDLKQGDILLADRAYGSYQLFVEILAQNADFVIRCKHRTFERYHQLFSTQTKKEAVAELKLPDYLQSSDNFPATLKVRFLRIPLKSGEVEVLATSLLDSKKFPYAAFKNLYYQRWKVETYFHTLKSRLSIDNFTGKTVEAIFQDFYSTIFVSGLESIITADANNKLRAKRTRHEQQVNRAVSFHTIKNHVLRLIFDPPADFDQQITNLFLRNPVLIRPDREKQPRLLADHDRADNRSSLYFQRYARKHVY